MAQIDSRKAHQELMTAEALSRRDEAVANIHRSHGIESEFTNRAQSAEQEEADRARLSLAAQAKDYEGTVLDRADAAGNVARDAAQANEGGIGVAASNSGPEDQDKRVQASPDAGSTEKSDDEVSKVEIPDNWNTLGWPQRRSLALKVARGAKVDNGDDADAAIKAELERRK